jgi:glycosyltransferase involved in cell wall biosynthesis
MSAVVPSLSIVVPLYNERDNVAAVTGALLEWAERNLEDFELVVVDDGSSDGSSEALPRHPAITLVRHERNRGLTAALRTGFSAATKEMITWCPGDGQIPPEAIGDLLAAHRGEAMVISTYHHRPDGLVRLLMSRTARLLARVAIGFGDRLEGIYLFRRALLDEIELVSTRSAGSVAFELAAKVRRRGLPIATTQITCLPRRSGTSKVAGTSVMRNFATYVVELWIIRQSLK